MVGVAIEDSDRPVAAFEAPDATVSLIFELEVTDVKGDTATDRVTVEVNNRAPTASAGYSRVAAVNAMVTLAGGASDMDIGHVADMEFLWSQKSGTLVTLATPIVNGEPVATYRTFTPTVVGDYGFKLRVTDPGDLFAEDEMTVHCCPAAGTSAWFDTGETRGCRSTKEKHQTRLNNGVTEYQWLSDPEPLTWSDYSDTGITRNTSYGIWTNTNEYRGSGASRERKQTRTVSWEKERTRTSQCNDSQSRWVAASSTETRWVDAPEPVAAPPKPTSSQWDVRYSNNKIQVKATSLPTVNPAVSEVRAYLEAGQPPNLTTVTEAIGTTLNSWVTVLSSSDTQWQTGNWAAHIRFENSIGNSAYSDGKSATVPAPVSPPRPRPTPEPETWGPWMDTGVREEDDTVVPRIIWKQQRRTSNRGNTETRWVRA